MSKILIITSKSGIQKQAEEILKREGFDVYTSLGGESISLAEAIKPDLVLLGVNLPRINGYELCRNFRNHQNFSRVPIILLSSQGRLDKQQGLECGASDYLMVPFEENELILRVKMNLKRVWEDRSRNLLTGLPGSEAIEEEIRKRVITKDRKFAVLFIDIDNFKAFNHAYGFLQGDEVIKFVAEIIKEAVQKLGKSSDFLGHAGGDDFVLITEPQRAQKIAKHIIKKFDSEIKDFYQLDDRKRGFVVTQTRQGAVLKYPIMSISVSAVSNEKKNISTHWEVWELGKEIKEYARNIPGSAYYADRRTK